MLSLFTYLFLFLSLTYQKEKFITLIIRNFTLSFYREVSIFENGLFSFKLNLLNLNQEKLKIFLGLFKIYKQNVE